MIIIFFGGGGGEGCKDHGCGKAFKLLLKLEFRFDDPLPNSVVHGQQTNKLESTVDIRFLAGTLYHI